MKNHTIEKRKNFRQNIPLKLFFPFLLVLIAVAAMVVAQSTSYTIFIIGDSTVSDYAESKYPFTGWGQLFSHFFMNGTVTVNNRAIGGRSSRSFHEEGRWASVSNELKNGDFLLIQFGHNDRDYSKEERYTDTTAYKSYLRIYVNESRAKGAIPVFVTPMNMNTWNGTTVRRVFTEYERGADYCGAMKNVADELNVPLIDLEAKSAEFMKSVGKAYLDSYHHMGLQPGEYPNYPDGYTDIQTHFQEMGSIINARMVSEGIKELSSHDDMGKLAEVLAPLHKVTVIPNKSNTGLVTVSGDFPAGVTVTVKVMPDNGETFLNWADADVHNVSSDKLYMFTMGDAPVTMHALFKGGDDVVSTEKKYLPNTNDALGLALNINIENNVLSISSSASVTGVKLLNIDGRSVYSKQHIVSSRIVIPVHFLSKGMYTAQISTTEGTNGYPLIIP